jgi:hypothetical protein
LNKADRSVWKCEVWSEGPSMLEKVMTFMTV